MELEQVGAEGIAELHSILEACGLDMLERFGLGHWIPAYPLELMQQDAITRNVYAVREGLRAVATFTVSTQAPDYYQMDMWQNPSARAFYVSRLAVMPAYQDRGIGRWCMRQIEQLATAAECSVVRLDAYYKHLRLFEFYQRLGYQKRGVLTRRTKRYGETGCVCFEKLLSGLKQEGG